MPGTAIAVVMAPSPSCRGGKRRRGAANGVQLADLLAYSVYRAFKGEDLGYPYFERVLGNFYRRRQGTALDGLKVWPDRSPLSALAIRGWDAYQQKALRTEGE